MTSLDTTASPNAAAPAWVPAWMPARLVGMVAGGGLVVLTGAGLSTESGIPDYRGPTGLARGSTPMQYRLFVTDAGARRRYWARSHLGWRRIAACRPNAGHRAVAMLQNAGLLGAVITQNVDGLHRAAGSAHVVELHGRLDRVVCLGCGERTARTELETRLQEANRGWAAVAGQVNPDGDVDLDEPYVAGFTVVDCDRCGGLLKPDVVFFGESVPPDRVEHSYRLVGQASGLLVLGSSLTVMSGRRFVLRAAQIGVPVAIVNQGPTRCDDLAEVSVDAPLGLLLGELAARVLPSRGARADSGAEAGADASADVSADASADVSADVSADASAATGTGTGLDYQGAGS